jgi:sugar/nucleoside kinase (ribokinase family)
LTGTGVDMKGYDGVAFIVGALKGEALAFAIKAQQDSASNFATAADLLGTSVAFSTAVGTDGLTILEVWQPRERYVRPIITVPDASAATPTFCISIRYKAKDLPQTNAGEQHISPAEGTA